MQQFKSDIKEYIQVSVSEALSFVKNLLKEDADDKFNEIIHMKSRLSDVEFQYKEGAIELRDRDILYNKIRLGLLEFIDELDIAVDCKPEPFIQSRWEELKSRLREGKENENTLVGKMQSIQAGRKLKEIRHGFSNSEEGLNEARQYVQNLSLTIQQVLKEIQSEGTELHIRFREENRGDEYNIALCSPAGSYYFKWRQEYRSIADKAVLSVTLFDRNYDPDDRNNYLIAPWGTPPQELGRWKYTLTYLDFNTLGWLEIGQLNNELTNLALTEKCFSVLLDRIAANEQG